MKTIEERFWGKVNIKSDNECWEWTAGGLPQGYGRILIQRRGILTHRLAYELTHGPIPKGMCILHKCDNPPCCNPNHLFLGTYLDNNRDKSAKKRINPPYGTKEPNHKLTEKDVVKIRQLYKNGTYQKNIATQFNVSQHLISLIVRKKAWKHID